MRLVKAVSTLASLAMAVLTVGGPAAAVEGLVGGGRADTIRAMGAALEALANPATGLSR